MHLPRYLKARASLRIPAGVTPRVISQQDYIIPSPLGGDVQSRKENSTKEQKPRHLRHNPAIEAYLGSTEDPFTPLYLRNSEYPYVALSPNRVPPLPGPWKPGESAIVPFSQAGTSMMHAGCSEGRDSAASLPSLNSDVESSAAESHARVVLLDTNEGLADED